MPATLSPDSSWTPAALEVLARACARHGGLESWSGVRELRLVPGRFSGPVPWIAGFGRGRRLPRVFEVLPHEGVVRFVGYPDADHVGVFENGAVRIERVSDGTVAAEARSHRASFRGFAKFRLWSALDALYFFGYSLAHYLSLPFSLSQARLLGSKTIRTRQGTEDVLAVELPPELTTHCRRQSFHFDAEGSLVRHDYHAEILGFWARGAHFWKRQQSFGGVPIALERHVVLGLGGRAFPLTALHATFLDAEVTRVG